MPRPWIERVAGALTHRNFRLVWFAALGSTIGTWMQQYAQALLVFELTQSKFYLGLDAFLAQLPILLFMLIGGVIADRHDRRRLLTGSQYVQASSALILAALVWSGHVTVALVLALSFITGCGQAFGGPAYQSMIPSLVPRRDLPNAIALNSTQFNLSRVLGPGVGAAVLATIGTAWCFAVNGVSFFFVIIALSLLQLPPHVPAASRPALGAELKSGLHYVRDNRVMFTLTILVTVSTFLAMPIMTMLPAFATEVLTTHGSAGTRLSMLMASQGLGAILGALVIGSLDTSRRMGRLILRIQFVLGLLIAGFALSTSLPLSLVLLFVSGVFFMLLFSISFSLVQLAVPDDLRGRVVSIYMVALRGGGPIGGIVAGALADRFTTPGVMAVNGGLLALVAVSMVIFRRGRALMTV
ncbi:MAG TPA: MFS transporter [Vicinamibacterales bacterium]|jgi:MFS family permease|nr:MFS transporter [Vicinamibacterales bacterium]